MRAHKLTRRVLVAFGVLAAGLVTSTTPALAVNGHGFSTSFGSGPCTVGPSEPCEGKFSQITGLAVNDATGDVYVIDGLAAIGGNKRVEYFNSAGVYQGQFDGSDAPGGTAFRYGGEQIAVDSNPSSPSAGDVYLADRAKNVVDKFTATGAYLCQFRGPKKRCLKEESEETPEEKEAPPFEGFGVAGLAVDSNGAVLIAPSSPKKIEIYSDALVNTFTSELEPLVAGFTLQTQVAGDAEGNFYVGTESHMVAKVDSAGTVLTPPGEELGGRPTQGGIAVDFSDNDVFLNYGGTVGEFAPDGSLGQEFGAGVFSSEWGIAVNSTSGAVYVGDRGSDKVDVFVEGPEPEAPVTEEAKEVAATTAVLHGELNPVAKAQAGWYFAYNLGGKCTGGQTTPVEAEGDVQAVKVQKEITGLKPSAQYTFCLVATNKFGATVGSVETLTTPPAPPEVVAESEEASPVQANEATLNATINPNNEATTYEFQYSQSANGQTLGSPVTTIPIAPPAPLEGFGEQAISVPTGAVLAPGTVYYYRVIAENAQSKKELKPAEGAVRSFTTPPMPVTDAPTSITGTGAVFNGRLTLDPGDTKYSFQYNVGGGSQCTGEESTPLVDAGSGTTTISAVWEVPSPEVPGLGYASAPALHPNTEYSVCLVATNSYGSQVGSPAHFMTSPAPPSIGSENATGLGLAGVSLEAEINPELQETTYYFEYATNEAKLAKGEGTKVQGASALAPELKELTANVTIGTPQPNTTYYYRVVAENESTAIEGKPVLGQIVSYGLPEPSIDVAENPTRSTVVLSGGVNPQGATTTYRFELITQAGYQAAITEGASDPYAKGSRTSRIEVEPDFVVHQTGDTVATELLPGTTYHYALVATNQYGTTLSPDGTFTTSAARAPLIETGGASNIAQNTASISGIVNTQGLETTYGFEIAPSTNYGPPTGLGRIVAGASEATATLDLSGLQPGTTYHYRITATNIDGTMYGEDRTFTTSLFENVLVTPPAPLPFLAVPAIVFPTEEAGTGKPTTRTLTRAQKLANALKACNRKPKNKRSACKKAAKHKYGPAKKK